ncbi:LRR receptor-like serine/threonine-protein kinase FLS2 [Vigna unguiculata]|uniref:LRR receptor-like serine/threonine-protein kinase FLS2 n=1 Tax=Vigna unguiculata TaxID=3917 RepID=A0A4D6NHA3_VIGUN|nr:LRR receptor-like serine/threonine-protein kinase FLS2 [Vigna unguiculata]
MFLFPNPRPPPVLGRCSSLLRFFERSCYSFPVVVPPSFHRTLLFLAMRIHQIFFHIFIPLCIIYLNIIINVATSHSLHHQQLLLLHLKDSLVFNPATSKKMVYWNQSSDCCQWNGVTCSKGDVIGLDLSQEFIFGGLDYSTLFELEYLQRLNLAYNHFNSSIPVNFGKLKSLRYLNLSNAGFHGQIPGEISHLTDLTTLDLSTPLTSQPILKLQNPNIAMFLQNLENITELYLDGVKVSAEGKEWCHALSSLQNLQVLSMSSCNISGPIDSSLATLEKLSIIRLSLNNISSSVPEFFANFSNLNVLEISSCSLTGLFPNGIFQLKTLKVFDISNNRDLHGVLPNFLPDAAFHSMNLSNTNFSGKLPGSISNLTQLVHLDLSFNRFTGPLPSFKMVKNLRYLSILHNNLTGVITTTHFEGLENLLSIDLGDNYLSGNIPMSLFTLLSLQELTLSRNGLDGLLDEFPNASSSKLELIDLSSNSLSGPIPASIFHIKGLRFLQLSDNDFNGTIRLDMVQRLQNLHTLGLSNNKLSVNVTLNDDHLISSFPSMKYLLLGSCNLGEFPGFLRNQTQINALDLSNNQIQGEIPNWIWRFKSLVYLNLSNNFLTNMEGPFDDLNSNLYILDLHSNQLTGSVPTFTKYVNHLDYSNNKFSTVPLNIDNTNNWEMLHIIDLASNNFTGILPGPVLRSLKQMMLSETKPQEKYENLYFDMFDNHDIVLYNSLLSNINKLQVIKLHKLLETEPYDVVVHLANYYRFTNENGGRYMDSVTVVYKALQMELTKIPTIFASLDLSSNHFEGPIPQELVSLRALNVLNLSHNIFSGHIPLSIGDLKNIESLDLSNNSLSGKIPSELAGLNFLAYLNLSFNHLWGEIPTGTQIQTFDPSSFEGNEGLCGPPLRDCSSVRGGHSSPTPAYEMHGSIDWSFLSVELGFIFGFGIVLLPLILFECWRVLYWKHVDDLLYMFVPQLGFLYEHHKGQRYRSLRWTG